MDFEESSESCDNFLKNVIEKSNNTSPADIISSGSEEKAAAIGSPDVNASNDRVSEYRREESFHSVASDEDDVTNINIGIVTSNSNESVDDYINKAAETNGDLSVPSQPKFEISKLIYDEKKVTNLISDDSELLFGSDKPENQDDTGVHFAKSDIPTLEMATEDENVATDDFFDDGLKDSPTNTEHLAVDSVRRDESEESLSNEVVDASSSDTRATNDNFRTIIVDEVDESFSLDEILEESECSEKDQTQVDSSNDDNLAFDDESMAIAQAENSENVILENGDELIASEKHQSCKSPDNNSADSFEVESHSICQEVVNTVTVENIAVSSEGKVENNSEENDVINFEDAGKNLAAVVVPCPVSSSTDDIAQEFEVGPEKSKNAESSSKENSSEAVTNGVEIIDSSGVTNNITIESSLLKIQIQDDFPNNHDWRSAVIPSEEDDQHSAAEDSTCRESSTEVSKDDVPSSHGDCVPSKESTDTLQIVSDIQNEEGSLLENVEIAESSNNPENNSLTEESTLNSTEDSTRTLRKRVSSQRRNNSDGSEPTLSDASLPEGSDSSMMTVETRNRTNIHRMPSKSTSESSCSRSSWQPKINNIQSASGNFSIRLRKFNDDAPLDTHIKEEVIDESYGMDYATKEKFNLVDFSIKLEKIHIDSDIEVISPSRQTRPAAQRSLDITSNRSCSRSEMLRNRRRSRTVTNRSRPNDRMLSKPSATNSSGRRPVQNQRRADVPVSTRSATRGDGKRVNRVNGQMAKESATRRMANNRRAGNPKASSKISTHSANDRGRSLRSAGTNADVEGDRDRINFLSIFNLRSRQGNSDDDVKGILVKPKINRVRSKRVSFRLPSEENASTEQSSSPKGRNSSKSPKEDSSKSTSKVSSSTSCEEDSFPRLQVKVPPLVFFGKDSTVKVVPRSVERKRKVPAQSNRKPASTAAKRSKSSAQEQMSEDEEIDENPYDKLEVLVDAARKTVDVWFECQCCNQKYFLIENAKQHVRTHFPNCLTN